MHLFYSREKLTKRRGAAAALCWLWLLLLALLPLGSRAATGGPTRPVQPSLATALAADGTLRPGINGSFDARSFVFGSAPDGRPVFRHTGTTGAGDYKWQDGFGLPEGINGFVDNGNVKAVVQVGNDFYVGGNFAAAGGAVANYVAKWNGTTWSALGAGTANGLNGIVRALAVAPNGDLYVGGDFTRAGGLVANGIARWNGTTWSALGTGTQLTISSSGGVYALAIAANGDVYAGGTFATAGVAATNGLARWNGTAWSALGAGLSLYASVNALAFDMTGNLYVGGSFSSAGGSTAAGIARWNGTAWNNLGGGARSGATSLGTVQALTVATTGDVYIGGDFVSVSGQSANNVARWNGTAWSALGAGVASGVTCLAVAPGGTVYVAGSGIATAGGTPINGVAQWNGTAWSSVGPVSGTDLIDAKCLTLTSGGELYLGGWRFQIGGTRMHGLGRWNGTAWSALGTGQGNGVYGQVHAVAVAANGDVYVGGSFDQVGNVSANSVAKWNGTIWSALGTAAANGVNAYSGPGSVEALTIGPNGVLYVGGRFSQAGGMTASNVARWSGTTWSTLADASGNEGVNGTNVYALAVTPAGDVYVGGSFLSAGNVTTANVAKWNGTAWSALGPGISGNYVTALAVAPAGDLYVGGYFTRSSGNAANYLMSWNGTAWSGVGSGVSGNVAALVFAPNGDLYVGGNFAQAGGLAARNVARWNGATWSALGMGLSNSVALPAGSYPPVVALAVGPAGELYAGGFFDLAGGAAAHYLAKWDGSTWNSTAFGTGLNNPVQAVGVLPGANVCVGGFFAGMGDTSKPSVAFGIFNPSAIPTATVAGKAAALSFSLYPNPTRSRATVQLVAVPARVTMATLTVLDVLGQLVRSQLAATTSSTELDLAGLAPGIYTVQLQAGSYSATQRLVVE